MEGCFGAGEITGVPEMMYALGPQHEQRVESTRRHLRTTPHRDSPEDSHDSGFWSTTRHPRTSAFQAASGPCGSSGKREGPGQ